MADFDIGKFADKLVASFPKIINFIADAVVLDIRHGINTSKDIHDRSFKPLKQATIKQKQRLGYTTRPLERTGAMKGVYVKKRATRKSVKAVVTMPDRAEYGIYHNLGGTTVKGKPPLREWFAISSRMDKKIDVIINRALGKI